MAYQSALSKGTGEALWGILTGLKELTDLGTQHLNHALGAAWEAWRYADEQRYLPSCKTSKRRSSRNWSTSSASTPAASPGSSGPRPRAYSTFYGTTTRPRRS
ncbi:MAG: hypothetical protein P8166_15995 [Candidatus Thiodiazotropha sp.]